VRGWRWYRSKEREMVGWGGEEGGGGDMWGDGDLGEGVFWEWVIS